MIIKGRVTGYHKPYLTHIIRYPCLANAWGFETRAMTVFGFPNATPEDAMRRAITTLEEEIMRLKEVLSLSKKRNAKEKAA